MNKCVEKARAAARTVQEEYHYDGVFSVFGYEKVKDPVTKVTSQKEVKILSDLPCHLSRNSIPAATQTESAANVSEEVKLFCSPDHEIPAGLKIVVTQAGTTEAFICSGIPAVYVTHQEVVLTSEERYA